MLTEFESKTGWSEFDVAGHRVEAFVPAALAGGGYDAALLWLHDVDGRSPRHRAGFERVMEQERLIAVCPQVGACWWLDQICPEFDTAITPMSFLHGPVMQFVEQSWGIAPPKVGVAGFGMGGQGAVNLAFRHARRFPVVAAVNPDLDFHQWHGCGLALDQWFPSREAARQQTAILHLHPLNWPRHMRFVCDPAAPLSFEGTERLLSKLVSTGIPFETDLESTAGGHAEDYLELVLPGTMKFLAERLRGVGE